MTTANCVPFEQLPYEVQQITKLVPFFRKGEPPRSWYTEIRSASGPDYVAIEALAHYVWWNRAEEVPDKNGNIIGYRTKFTGHAFQQTYNETAEWLQVTKEQLRYAWRRNLKKLGLAWVELINSVKFKNGRRGNNVPYIHLNAEAIAKITYDLREEKPKPTSTNVSQTVCEISQTNTKNYQGNSCTEVSGGVLDAPVLSEEEKERGQVLSDLKLLIKWNPYLQKECDRSSLSDLKKALQSVKRKNARDGYVKGGYLVRALRSIREGLDDLPRPKTPLVSEIKKMEYGDRLWVREDGKLYPAKFEEWDRTEAREYKVSCRIWGKLYTFSLDKCLIFPNGGEPPEPDRPVWGPQAERLKPARPGTPVLFIHNGEEKEGRFSAIEEGLSGPIAYVFCEGIGDLKIDPEELQVKADFYCGIEDDVILDYSQEIQPHELRSLDPENRYTFIAWNPYTGKWYAFEYNGFLYGEDGLLVRGVSKHGDIMVPIGRVRFQNATLPEGKHFFTPPPGFIRSDYRRV